MSYEPTTWKSGDVVTSAKLNKMEQGIANAGALIVHDNNGTLDKTWQEIHDAAPLVWLFDDGNFAPLSSIVSPPAGPDYYVGFYDTMGSVAYEYTASSADSYPVLSQ